MPADPTQVLLALCGVISAMAGYLAVLYRESLKRSEERVARLEEREDTLLREIAKTVGSDALATAAIAAGLTRVVDYVTEEQIKDRYALGPGRQGP